MCIRDRIKDDKLWNTICDRWWRLCKDSDTAMQDEFDGEWTALVRMIEDHSSPEAFAKQKGWLQSMSDRKSKWAACHTWTNCTFGIHSTARAEALHSSLAHFCSKHSTVINIVKNMLRLLFHLGSTNVSRQALDDIRSIVSV